MNEIGNSIRRLRLNRGLTQAQVADALQVQYQTVSKWETGATIPDTAMLPRIADFFGASIDELFGRNPGCRTEEVSGDDAEFLLHSYAQMYGPEAGPWNLSATNKYLEYRFADFFEKNFTVAEGADLCNIGIGAGEWDHFLSYQLKGGTLTSIDKLEICCRQLEKRLICENNPNKVTVICADAMTLNLEAKFDIVTIVGSTVIESQIGLGLLEQAMGFVKPGGSLYYQSLSGDEDPDLVIKTAFRHSMRLGAFSEDHAYGFHCHYYKFEK